MLHMTLERYPNLEGRSILIVESKNRGGILYDNCFSSANMRKFEFAEWCPQNLLEFMNQKDIELAIIHPSAISDAEEIIAAHKAGKKIVVIEGVWCTSDQGNMYQRLEKEGIPLIEKELKINEEESLKIYDQLFK
jgi:hypothetical protein